MANSRKFPPSVNPIDTLAYWRHSSDPQEASIPQQHDWGLDTCARDNLHLVGEDSDPGISGADFDNLEGLHRIIALAQKLFRQGRPARRLLLWKSNRVSRADTCRTHAEVIHPLRQAGITHVQTSDGKLIDLHDPQDLLLFNIQQDAQNAAYLSSLASDVMRGKADVARQGCWNGGPVPLGYRLHYTGDPRFRRKLPRLILGPETEVELVKWLYRTYHETKTSFVLLARELNRRGVKPPRAQTWSGPCIRKMLQNRTYLGEVKWNAGHVGKFCQLKDGVIQSGNYHARDEVRRRKGHKTLKRELNAAADAIIVTGAHDGIIEEPLFDAVQMKIASAQTPGRTSLRDDRFYELADLVYCGHCKAKLWLIPNEVRGRKYPSRMVCSRRRQQGRDACLPSSSSRHEDILARVMETLARDLGTPAAQAKIRAALEERAAGSQQRSEGARKKLEKQVKALEAKKLMEARRLLEMTAGILESVMAAHQDTLDALAQARRDLLLLSEKQSVSTATIQVAERSIASVKELPELVALIETMDGKETGEVLHLRRKVRDNLFALISSVRLFWRPLTLKERRGRKGKGISKRKHELEDVQLTLHPHIQDALLNTSASETTSGHSFSNVQQTEPLILSFRSPFAA